MRRCSLRNTSSHTVAHLRHHLLRPVPPTTPIWTSPSRRVGPGSRTRLAAATLCLLEITRCLMRSWNSWPREVGISISLNMSLWGMRRYWMTVLRVWSASLTSRDVWTESENRLQRRKSRAGLRIFSSSWMTAILGCWCWRRQRGSPTTSPKASQRGLRRSYCPWPSHGSQSVPRPLMRRQPCWRCFSGLASRQLRAGPTSTNTRKTSRCCAFAWRRTRCRHPKKKRWNRNLQIFQSRSDWRKLMMPRLRCSPHAKAMRNHSRSSSSRSRTWSACLCSHRRRLRKAEAFVS
mmetsp:Transcript_31945/g.85540  ORF Transcript_31945/g.85540 Transcript_31945/m.85540 type:complete len:291 (-) Transcript_31945:5658-6530(-)